MIRTERQDAVGLLTLGRPERANALDAAHWQALADAVRACADDGARVVVITGEGRSFCAGGDLKEPDYDALLAACDDSMDAITSVPVPVIAHVNGPAIGAGLQLAAVCDLRVAGPTARFAIPAAAISRPVRPTVIRTLVALAGLGGARALLIGGDELSADRAHQLGFVDRLGDLSATLDWAGSMARHAPLVVEFFKRELSVVDEDESARFGAFLETLLASDDYAEANRAYTEKRAPRFVGR